MVYALCREMTFNEVVYFGLTCLASCSAPHSQVARTLIYAVYGQSRKAVLVRRFCCHRLWRARRRQGERRHPDRTATFPLASRRKISPMGTVDRMLSVIQAPPSER